jgi:hypothetical protein
VGTVFDIDLRLERDPQTRDLVQRPHGCCQRLKSVPKTPRLRNRRLLAEPSAELGVQRRPRSSLATNH